jgi:transposase-like protein
MRTYRKYTLDFKLTVVADYVEDRVSLRELSRRHGIARNLILIWAAKYQPAKLARLRGRKKRVLDYERKIAELERTVTSLTMELELLKQGSRPMPRMLAARL